MLVTELVVPRLAVAVAVVPPVGGLNTTTGATRYPEPGLAILMAMTCPALPLALLTVVVPLPPVPVPLPAPGLGIVSVGGDPDEYPFPGAVMLNGLLVLT